MAPGAPTTAPPAVGAHPRPARDATLLALGALALRIPAFEASRHLGFDDGVYGASAVAMRHGAVPFRDVFSSQGPLHLPLVYAGDLLGLRTANGPRVAAVAAGVLATVAVYFAGRRVTTRAGAVLAAVLVATSGSVLWTTGPITSDGPTLALGALAFGLALRWRERPGPAAAIAVGLAVGAGTAVKPALAAVGAVPVLWLLWSGRRPRDLGIAAASAAALGLAVTVPFGLADVWDQAVRYQLDSERERSMLANARKVASTLADRDLLLLAVAAAAAAAVLLAAARRGPRRPGPPATGTLPPGVAPRLLALWLALLLAFLVTQPALWRNHLAALVVPAALLVATRPPPRAWLAVAVVVALPFQVVHISDVLAPAPYRGASAEAHVALGALPSGAWAISDEPGLVWRAGRRTPPDLVDTSFKRLEQGRITTASLVAEARRPQVCAVLVWSATHFGALPDLPQALAAAGYAPVRRFAGSRGARILYERTTCAP